MGNKPDFWYGDPHTHSKYSDGLLSVHKAELVAAHNHLDMLGIADHDDVRSAHIPSLYTPRIKTVEITTSGGHMQLILRSEVPEKAPPLFMTPEDAVMYAWDHDAFIGIVHPNLGPYIASMSTKRALRMRDAGYKVDFVERRNGSFVGPFKHLEAAADKLVAELEVAETGASDNHFWNQGLSFRTAYPKYSDNPVEDFHQAIREKTTRAETSPYPAYPISLELKIAQGVIGLGGNITGKARSFHRLVGSLTGL